jgi:hypothetical protein
MEAMSNGSAKRAGGRARTVIRFFAPRGTNMPVQKRSYSLDERAEAYVAKQAKQLKRSASSVLSELVLEAARQEAREQALQELGKGVEISDRAVNRWLKKLGAS